MTVAKKTGSSSNPEEIPPDLGTVADGVHILGGLGNALTVELGGSVLQIDTGPTVEMAESMLQGLAKITDDPVGTIAFSHGHLGYNFACGLWLAAASKTGKPQPQIIAHEQAAVLIQQYQQTDGLMKLLLDVQMHKPLPPPPDPLPLTMPGATFSDGYTVHGQDRIVQLISAPSETDGAIAAWVPDVEVLYAGPCSLPLLPNIGMPLWPTGDARVWADTLDRLARLKPQFLIPSYGKVMRGDDTIQEYFSVTAEALRFIRSAAIEKLNEGCNLNTALNTIEYPADLFDHPYLAGTYGCREFIVRQVWSSIAGWWDRNPTHLEAAPEADAAQAVRSAISDPDSVLAKAGELLEEGNPQLALHVVDLLALTPDEPYGQDALKLKAKICATLAESGDNFVVKSLYASCADILANPPEVETGIR